MNSERLLLVDVGNTRVKWAYADGGIISDVQARYHNGDAASAFIGTSGRRTDSIWVSDVTDKSSRAKLRSRLRGFGGVEPHFVASEASHMDLVNGYVQPERLGVDRWLMLVAAWQEVRRPLCVVCVGTALTFDAVDENGRHLGGVIAPGLHAMQSAVLDSTRISVDCRHCSDYTDGLGLNTVECVRQGALNAVTGLVARLIGFQPRDAALFLTGGDANIVMSFLSHQWMWRPDLVLEGLMSVAIGQTTP